MEEFIGEVVEVERAARAPRPVSFRWRGEVHEVAEILKEWVDVGYGKLPRQSRRWYTRRHRRYFVVKDAEGATFELYLDYRNRSRQTWFLTKRLDAQSSPDE